MTSRHSTYFAVLFVAAYLYLAASQNPSCSSKTDVVFVVDQSGSIQDANPRNGSWDNWELVKDFIIQIIRNSKVSFRDTHFALVTFGNLAVTRFDLNKYYEEAPLIAAVKAIPPGNGQTNLYGGLHSARTTLLSVAGGARPDAPQVIIVITDGHANVNEGETVLEAQRCHASGISVFSVGVTNNINEAQLKAVSSPPHEKNKNYWTTPDFTSLATIVSSVAEATCDPPKAQLPECRVLDLAIAVDIPNSNNDCIVVKNFIIRFITLYLPIDHDEVRLSLVTFGASSATVQFRLNRYMDENQLKEQISLLPCTPSYNGDPSQALKIIDEVVFTTANGARTGTNRVVLILMDNSIPANSRLATVEAAGKLRTKQVRVVAMGMSADIGVYDLQLVASTERDYISTISYHYLEPKIQLLGTVLCNPAGSWEVACPAIADIVIALDQSTSIVSAPGGYANWDNYLRFLVSIAQSFPISQSLTRIGVLKFSYSAKVAFHLNRYSDRENLTNAILNLQLEGGETNIQDALRFAREEMFQERNGARNGVPHLLILITDGRANIDATRTIPEANKTKAADVEIFTVGITTNIDVRQMYEIASYPPETHYFFANDFAALSTILADLCQVL